MQCGLLGKSLSHSYSPRIHKEFGEYEYDLFEVEPNQLENFLISNDFTGLNVTLPYKKAVIPYCDSLTPIATKMGAVNTLVKKGGKIVGHNTDYYGFLSTVQRCGVSLRGKKTLVLGSGGASATVTAVLNEIGANVTVISRTGADNYSNLDKHKDAALIVNATPVGMYPDTDHSPVNLHLFPSLECVIDLIYNPANTKLIQQAQSLGIPSFNGLWMLVAQAKQSAELFTNTKISNQRIADVFSKMRFEMENIILIGMPGCGKSTVGARLAEKLNRLHIDTDLEIERRFNRTAASIISCQGEAAFRALEAQVLRDVCNISGAVISTGGGCVTNPQNYAPMHSNSKIIWLQRDISKLSTSGRPLSQSTALTEIYEHRKTRYQTFQDIVIDNNNDISSTVDTIILELQKETH